MSILDAIRSDCSGAVWSRGVQIARGDKVVLHAADTDEVVLRVQMLVSTPPFTVHLWPRDEDWACDCPSPQNTCVHIAGAVIAWNQARLTGRDLAGSVAAKLPQIGYRFVRSARGLRLRRVAMLGGREGPIPDTTLGSPKAPDLTFTVDDQAVEQVMRVRFDRVVPRELMPRLLDALANCSDVRVEDELVRASSDPVVPHGRVESEGEGFRLRIVRDPEIDEVYGGGVVRTGDRLRPIGRGGLKDDQYRLLSRGVYYEPAEVGKLVAETLPHLENLIPIEYKSDRLPTIDSAPPRLVLETSRSGETLIIMPLIVYGDPPTAHVERGRLVLRGGVVPIRNKRSEDRLARRAADELGLAVGLEARFRGETAVRFVDNLPDFSGQVTGPGWKFFRRAGTISPQIRIDGDKLDVDWGGADGEQLRQAWQSEGRSLVPLTDGGWAELPKEWLAQHGHRVFDLLASREPSGKVPRHALFDLAKLCQELNEPPPPGLEQLRSLVDDFEGIPSAKLPDDLRAELRTYQRLGVNWLTFLREAGMGGILADDMGLGKTLQALCVLEGHSLVVAPTSVLHNWAAETARFRPNMTVCVYHGPKRVLDREADIVLTSYALLRLDQQLLCEREWDNVVLDEAQAIKNPQSQVAQAAFKLRARFRTTLTGTPVENRLDELWSQFHFLNPGLLSGRRDFQDRYAKPIAAGEPGVAMRLRERIRPFVLRRLKREVAPELPARTDITLRCTLDAEERRAYNTVRVAAQEKLVRQIGGNDVMAALEALLRLRQASCHTSLLPGHSAETSSKVELLMSTLDEVIAEDHKSLVFSQWTAMLNLVEPHLDRRGIRYVRLDGSTRDRQRVVEEFQSDDGPPVFLISLKAGGTGLNLTEADHVFLLDPWWNPAVEDQAADRAHRIGQSNPVMVYRLVAEDTVEERILSLQSRKRALAEAAIGGADQAAAITRDELMALLDG
ncbi:MAG: superfamily II DNA or RNA helicase [Myxococcota bacterium]|jgi:superfamily II DNA or RNA helicase